MIAFAVTGFTLNHASQIEAHPSVTRASARLPDALLKILSAAPKHGAVPGAIARFLDDQFNTDTDARDAEWSSGEAYIALPRPGGDAWVSIDLSSGNVQYELTKRGWISYLNDLHKGRNTGGAWSLFIDVFACACVVFSITGLFLIKLHARHRGATWPLVGLGFVAPVLLAIVFIH